MNIDFSIKPVKAAHIAMNKRTLPPHVCHGTMSLLAADDEAPRKKYKNPNNHCRTNKVSVKKFATYI